VNKDDYEKNMDMVRKFLKDGQVAAKQALMEHYPDMTDLQWEADQIILLFNDGSKKQFSQLAFYAAKKRGDHLFKFIDSVERTHPVH